MSTVEERVRFRIRELRSLELYFYSDNRSWEFFRENPANTDELIVNEKISALNNGIIDASDVPSLAQRIIELPTDQAIKEVDLDFIPRLASLYDRKPTPGMVHFCSLYCNYHNQNGFPIMSPTAVELLLLLHEKTFNKKAEELNLHEYRDFKSGLDKVCVTYGLDDLNYYQVDKFLWINASRIKEFIGSL